MEAFRNILKYCCEINLKDLFQKDKNILKTSPEKLSCQWYRRKCFLRFSGQYFFQKQTNFRQFNATARSSCSQMFFKIGVFKSFANFTEKYRCWNLFHFFKKRLQHRFLPVKFARYLRTPFLAEHLQLLLLNSMKFSEINRSLETYSKPCQASKMKLLVKIVNG